MRTISASDGDVKLSDLTVPCFADFSGSWKRYVLSRGEDTVEYKRGRKVEGSFKLDDIEAVYFKHHTDSNARKIDKCQKAIDDRSCSKSGSVKCINPTTKELGEPPSQGPMRR